MDEKEPQLWFEISGNYNCSGRTLRSALKGKALAVSKKCKSVLIISTENNKKTLHIQNSYGGDIVDHQIFGEEENYLALLTEDGWLVVQKFTPDLSNTSSVVIDRLQIELNSEREEQGLTLAVCSKSKYFAIHLCGVNCRGSRVVIYEFSSSLFLKRSEVDLGAETLKRYWAMAFYKYFGNRVLLTAISCDEKNPNVVTYCFDEHNGSFKELRDMRKSIAAKWPFKMTVVGNRIYSSDNHAKIINISYNI